MDSSITKDEHYSNGRFSNEFSKNDFLRKAFIQLTAASTTPIDVLSSEFGEVTDSEKQLLLVKAHVDVDVTCQIGNDRVEEYWDKEKYRENGVEKVRDVKKTRTVTDWSPLVFSRNEDKCVVVLNTAEDVNELRTHMTYSKVIKKGNVETLEPISDSAMNYNDRAIARAKRMCMQSSVEDGIPGAKYKDVSSSGKTTVLGVNGFIVPEYDLTYKYQGREYAVNGPACGVMDISVEGPRDDDSIQKTTKKKSLPMLLGGIGCIVLCLILAVCQISSGICTAIGIAGIALCFGYLFFKKYMRNKLINNRQQDKLKKLTSVLANKGLAPLTDSERQAVINAKYNG